ncbi:hypothetical protein B0H34DRAFT_507723 [Crassisporium funariophilum]|nr:hypothetical protein B0H34DRAFT_507723 [Crassisporium funariophilum]
MTPLHKTNGEEYPQSSTSWRAIDSHSRRGRMSRRQQSATTQGRTPTSASTTNKAPSNPFNGCPGCIVRDNDPRVRYTGHWTLNGTQSSTTHSTLVEGSTVALRFNGSGIIVFGTVPASNTSAPPPTAAYHLDASPPFVTTLAHAEVAVADQPLFASSSLSSDDEHVIFINVTNAGASYTLARFFIFPKATASKNMIGSVPSDMIPLPSSSKVTPTPRPAPSSQNTVKVVAGVLGTLLFLLTLAGVLFFIFRRKTQTKCEIAEKGAPQISRGRPDTVYTSFTSTESILRNDPSVWLRSPSYSSRSERSTRRSDIYQVDGRASMPPPLPPKPFAFPPSKIRQSG